MDQYRLYSQMSAEITNESQNNIQEDIKQMRNINEFDEIETFIENRYGSFNPQVLKHYADNTVFFAVKEGYIIEAAFIKDNSVIFGKHWEFIPEETEKENS